MLPTDATGDPAPVSADEFDAAIRAMMPAGPLAVAVSGGADSLAVLFLAREWCAGIGLPAPIALTVDHGLRPESAAEAAQVASWMDKIGVPHHTLQWHAPPRAANIQAAAREGRYRLVGDWMKRHSLSSLLTGHTLDDQAETFLLRLGRGSGLDGLAAMRPLAPFPLPACRTLRILRPALAMSHARLVATLKARGQAWIEDPSNENGRYLRARLRRLMPLLAAAGVTAERIALAATNLQRASIAIAAAVSGLEADAVEFSAAGFALMAPEPLAAAPREVGLRLVSQVLKTVGGADFPCPLAQVEAVLDWMTSSAAQSGRGRTVAGCRLARRPDGRILAAREEGALLKAAPSLSLCPGETGIWDGRWEVSIAPGARPKRVEVRALGREGAKLASGASLPRIEPRRIASTLPAIWDGDSLLCAPLAGIGVDWGAEFRLFRSPAAAEA